MKELHISNDVSLSLDAVTNTHLILARRRVGKSYTAAVMAEEMVKAGLPWVALDPTGVWWGLTSSADGKSEGLPVIIIGGPHGHIPLEPSAGKVIANLVVDNPGWYVIDFSRLDHRDDEIRFARDFGVQLYRRKQRKPSALHLFVDEADMFVPQKLPKKAKEMLDAYDAIVRRGGVYGIGITLISQRPALVNKDVTTQCETLIALQTSAPEDQDPILDWVSRNGTKEQLDEIKKTLASLKVGQAWVFSPNSDVFKLIRIRTRETFNSSATPKPGAKPIEPKIFSKIDIEKLGEEIASTVERSKQEDPAFLHREIERLRRELQSRPGQMEVKWETKIEHVEVPALPQAELDTIHKSLADLGEHAKDIKGIGEGIEWSLSELDKMIVTLKNAVDKYSNGHLQAFRESVKPSPRDKFVREHFGVDSPKAISQTATAMVRAASRDVQYPEGITGPMQRVIDAIAWIESIGLHKPQRSIIAFLADYSANSSSFTNALGALRTNGMITYPNSDTVDFTDRGRSLANPMRRPLTTEELHNVIFHKLPGPQARTLRPLIESYPDPMQREELAERAGYSVNSSSFTNALGALRSLGVIDYPSSTEAVALPVLFLE